MFESLRGLLGFCMVVRVAELSYWLRKGPSATAAEIRAGGTRSQSSGGGREAWERQRAGGEGQGDVPVVFGTVEWGGQGRDSRRKPTPGFCGLAGARMALPLADRNPGRAAGGVGQRAISVRGMFSLRSEGQDGWLSTHRLSCYRPDGSRPDGPLPLW